MKKVNYVDPMIGTVGDEQAESFHGGGKTYPGACVPGGMVQLSPDTVTGGDNGTGYNYCHDTIEGFSFNHLSGIGWYGDLGNLQIMPIVGETDLRSGSNKEIPFKKGNLGWKSEFSHDDECAEAGYYSVLLKRYNIQVEATVSEYTGMLRITYPQNADARAIFNFSRRIGGKADYQWIDVINDRRLEGHVKCTPAGGGLGRGDGGISYDFYFVCEFSEPAAEFRFFSDEEYINEQISSCDGEDIGLLARFTSLSDKPLIVKCGISYTDIEGARKNFDSENSDFDFDSLRKKASEKWEKVFDILTVEGSDETDKKLFYTCLYHVLLDPRLAADSDGRFTLDGKIQCETDYTHRTVFSGWDVYRSEFPLLSIIRPDIVNDEVNSLLKIAQIKKTSFPRWEVLGLDSHSMVGDPGLIVVADAYTKGIRNYDAEKAYEVSVASSNIAQEIDGNLFTSIRPYSEQYIKDAYVPEKLSDTLELLLADYSLSRFARALGKDSDADYYLSRAKKYVDNYNPELGFMAPRYKSGKFVFEENEYDDDGCVESNVFQQSWFVPYDVIGLSKLFGESRTLELLERFFSKAQLGALWNDDYNHSNEPCHNITHYFNMLGLPHRTQYWTRRVQNEAYRTGAFGFCGNEDVGQLSAWYVLSAIGFAQLCPGHEAYLINTPLFHRAKIKLDPAFHSCSTDNTFTVQCDKDPLLFPYICSANLNGKSIDRSYLTFSEITSGGVLSLELSESPCETFGLSVPDFLM